MRISDWSSDVCSSDLDEVGDEHLVEDLVVDGLILDRDHIFDAAVEIARHLVGRRNELLPDVMRQRGAIGERPRTEERRDGKGCGSTGSSRGAVFNLKKRTTEDSTQNNDIK